MGDRAGGCREGRESHRLDRDLHPAGDNERQGVSVGDHYVVVVEIRHQRTDAGADPGGDLASCLGTTDGTAVVDPVMIRCRDLPLSEPLVRPADVRRESYHPPTRSASVWSAWGWLTT